jgi:hypothetical protein
MIFERERAVNPSSGLFQRFIRFRRTTSIHFCLEDEQIQNSDYADGKKRESIEQQLKYYLSEENLSHDDYLVSKMDQDDYVSIAVIANFNKLQKLTTDIRLITEVLKGELY